MAGGLAQSVERVTVNHDVVGSSPASASAQHHSFRVGSNGVLTRGNRVMLQNSQVGVV